MCSPAFGGPRARVIPCCKPHSTFVPLGRLARSDWSVLGAAWAHSYLFVLDSGNPNVLNLNVSTPITSAWKNNGDGAWNARATGTRRPFPTGLDDQALFNDPSVTTPGTVTIPTGGATVGTIKLGFDCSGSATRSPPPRRPTS